jgi:dihydroxyacetone kinase
MRTLLDSLVPAINALLQGVASLHPSAFKEALKAAAEESALGTQSTANMGSLAGRANYVSEDLLRGCPDPGARAVDAAFAVVYSVLTQS